MGRAKSPEAIARKRERDKRYAQERRDWLKDHCFCERCGHEFAEPGRCRCKQCEAIHKAKEQSRREADRARKNALYQYRRDNGLCITCGRPAAEGRKQCKKHLQIHAFTQMVYRIEKKLETEADLAREGVYMR